MTGHFKMLEPAWLLDKFDATKENPTVEVTEERKHEKNAYMYDVKNSRRVKE